VLSHLGGNCWCLGPFYDWSYVDWDRHVEGRGPPASKGVGPALQRMGYGEEGGGGERRKRESKKREEKFFQRGYLLLGLEC